MTAPLFRMRSAQVEFMRIVDAYRITGLLTRRQFGKTTIASLIALKKMMQRPGHTVIFGSVKLDLGREIVRKEADAVHKAITAATGNLGSDHLMKTVDSNSGKPADKLSADDFADLYEHSRLEFRLYHSRTLYSRTKVVALTPEAVGETGDLILDEVGRVKRFQEVWEAVKPIIASQPTFRCLLTTTPPPDDTHYSFDLLAPPIDADFPINPKGNTYRSELGVHVLRVTAWDAHADGVLLYDDETGAPIDPDTARAKDHDKDSWDRNYGCRFVLGGTAAVGLLVLDTAQRRGIGECRLFTIDSDLDMSAALAWITERTGKGTVGIGLDIATTTRSTSNPSSLVVAERHGAETIIRAILVWKTSDPREATERIRNAVLAVAARKDGGPARRLCIDATSERYFAEALRRELGALVPVELVVASETIQGPGMTEAVTFKQFLGAELVGELDDNHMWLPPERYLREDFRLVKKEKGSFVCEPDSSGRHGDTFDGTKLALRALRSGSSFAYSTPAPKAAAVGRMWS